MNGQIRSQQENLQLLLVADFEKEGVCVCEHEQTGLEHFAGLKIEHFSE